MSAIAKKEYFDLQPQTFEQAMKYAELIANSSFVPNAYKGKPGDVMIAIQMGYEIGLKPIQAVQNISVINGRPAVWGDAMLALVKAFPDHEYTNETFEGNTYHCTTKRKGQPEVVRSFSIDDAKTANLWGKQGPWTQYPKRMLQMRARGFALRDQFPDVLKGIITIEEAQDYPIDPIIKGESFKVSEIKNIVDSQQDEMIETAQLEHQEAVIIAAVTFEQLQKEFESAKNIMELKEAALKVKSFTGTEEEKSSLRNIYEIRQDEFKTATQ